MYVCVCVYIYIYIYIYKRLNHFTVHLELTQHCKSTMLQYKIKVEEENYFEVSKHKENE